MRDKFSAWVSITILLTLYGVAYLDRQVLNLLIEPIRSDLRLSDFQLSLIAGFAFVLFYSLCGLPIGSAVDRFSRKGIIFGGVMIWGLGAAACGLARSFWHLLFARFAVGAGEAALLPAAYSLIADLFPKERLSFAMGLFTMGAILGGGLSLVVGGLLIGLAARHGTVWLPLIGEIAPWQQVLLISGLPALLLGWLVFLIPGGRRPGAAAAGRAAPGLGEALRFIGTRRRFFGSHFFGFSINNMMSVSFLVWGPTYLHRAFGWNLEDVGLSFGAMVLIGGVVGSIASGALADALFRRGIRDAHLRMYVWGSLLMGLSGIVAVLSRSPFVFFTFGTAAVAIKTLAGVAASALQIATPPEFRGKVSSIYLLVFNVLGSGLGPAIVASFTDFLFHDPQMLGASLALNFVIFSPLSMGILALGLAPMRAAVAAQEASAFDKRKPVPEGV